MKSEVFNADCLEMMRAMPDKAFDLAIVDPPYANDGFDMMHHRDSTNRATPRTAYKYFANEPPTDEYFAELCRISVNQIVWGGNFFGLKGGYICWNKFGTAFGDAELAYCSMTKAVRVFEYRWNGMLQEDMSNKEQRIHPTQKPVALYKWLLTNYAKPGQTILDSHLGSGSSRIAAYDLGFDFTGYEKDFDYWKAQEDRFARHVAQGRLFEPEEKTPEQLQIPVNTMGYAI